MAEDTDGVAETFDDSLRIALTVAAQFGERIARLREQMSRQKEAAAVQEAREISSRFDAERGATRASLVVVNETAWWDQASPVDIAAVHETATAWRDVDDFARSSSETIIREVQDHYGIDVNATGADPATVATTVHDSNWHRSDAADGRTRGKKELTAAQMLFAYADSHEAEANKWADVDWNSREFDGADQADYQEFNARDADWTQAVAATEKARTATDAGELMYDSAERRRQLAAGLVGVADQKTIDARILADGDNAKHPREALTVTAGKGTKVRTTGAGVERQRTRGGLTR